MIRAAAAGRRVVIAIALAAALGMTAPAGAVRSLDAGIGTAAVKRAIDVGRSPDSDSSRRFHDEYVIPLGDRLLDRLEIVTEFRRVVLATEDHARFGNVTWGLEQAEAMLQPWRDKVSLVLYVTFSPGNTYRTMPRFGIVLYARSSSAAPPRGSGASRIEPIDLIETPRYVSGQPAPPGTPTLAGIVEATFVTRGLDRRGTYLAGIFLEDRELRRVDLDFGRIE